MPMGRPPVPRELKERRGTARPDRLPIPAGELPAIEETPRAPRGLSPQARQLWADIWQGAKLWVTLDLDRALIEQTCRLYDEIGQYRRDLAKYGPLIREPMSTPSGKVLVDQDGKPCYRVVPNPVVKMLRDAEKAWNAYLVLLAIPPTERARLGLTQVKAQSKLEKLAAGRAKRSQSVPDSGMAPS